MPTLYTCHVTYLKTTGGQAVGTSGWLRNGGHPLTDRRGASKLTFEQMGALLQLIDLPYDQELLSFTAYPVKN